MPTIDLTSIESRAWDFYREKFPQSNRELFERAYYLSETSAEKVHDRLLDSSYEAFLENYSIKISPNRRQISHLLLPLSELQKGESFIMLQDSSYGLVHVFRESFLNSLVDLKVA